MKLYLISKKLYCFVYLFEAPKYIPTKNFYVSIKYASGSFYTIVFYRKSKFNITRVNTLIGEGNNIISK